QGEAAVGGSLSDVRAPTGGFNGGPATLIARLVRRQAQDEARLADVAGRPASSSRPPGCPTGAIREGPSGRAGTIRAGLARGTARSCLVGPERQAVASEGSRTGAGRVRCNRDGAMAVNAFSVRLWGVRGSIPCPGPSYARYGGNTACI